MVEIKIKIGDKVSKGDLILTIDQDSLAENENASVAPSEEVTTGASSTVNATTNSSDTSTSAAESSVSQENTAANHHADLVVLGSGPGGYTAAFRAADLGLSVIIIERYENIGGVCLNVGCIPSKALLHAAKVIEEADHAKNIGVSFNKPEVDIASLKGWKSKIVSQLTSGLAGLAKKRKVTILQGYGEFINSHQIAVRNKDSETVVEFKQAIIAVGSLPVSIPGFPHDDPRVIDSTGALELSDIPANLLIVGGGIIGLEMATVYHALGSNVSVVEMLDQIMTGADPDMVRPLLKKIKGQYENIWTKTKVTSIEASDQGIEVSFDGKDAPQIAVFDKVLVAVGRSPNGNRIGAEKAGITTDERGFISVDNQMRTNISHIFAIGDVVGQPMLAHKAVHEGKTAAEVAAGQKSSFDARVIPSVAYTDPEVAWVGLTESEAKAANIPYEKGVFPWAASGRALSQDRSDGTTKLLFDPKSHRIIGAAVTGISAGDLIAEATLAIEMNADATDISLTIHPHPTLAETIGFAAEAAEGTITDLYLPKKK